jgi:hypothetical protein
MGDEGLPRVELLGRGDIYGIDAISSMEVADENSTKIMDNTQTDLAVRFSVCHGTTITVLIMV